MSRVLPRTTDLAEDSASDACVQAMPLGMDSAKTLASDACVRATALAMASETVTAPDDPGVAQKHQAARKATRRRDEVLSAYNR